MCSIVEDEFADEPVHVMPIDEKPKITFDLCKKCKENKAILKLKAKDEQCESCFQSYVRHKFRATLGATKIVKRDSKVLFYFSGEKKNVCLLDMIKFGLEQEAHKRLVFEMELIFVDEFVLRKDYSEKTYLEYIGRIREILQKYERFKCFYLPFGFQAEILEFKDLSNEILLQGRKSCEKFLATQNSIKISTSRQDFIEETKRNLLYETAKKLSCNFIFLSEISINLAKRLISNVALGRGGTVSLDVGFCDDRIKEIRIIRPLRELDVEELDYYVKFNEIQFIHEPPTEETTQSIQSLTSNFIDGLQENFSSTISSVFRTGDKLGNSNLEDLTNCKFCKGKMDIFDSKTLPAIEYSRLLSRNSNFEENLLKEVVEKAKESLTCGKSEILRQLCHSCRNIFEDLDGNDEFLIEIFGK